MKLSRLAHQYIGGLTHAHTVLSNHPSHRESDLTVDRIVDTLSDADLAGTAESPLQFILLNEHPSDPARPHRLSRFSPRGRQLLAQRRRQMVGRVPIMYGLEVSLLPQGGTDLTPRLADHCAMVIASRHSLPRRTEHSPSAIMDLFYAACHNPSVDVIGHPARYIENESEVDWPQVFDWAAGTGTAIEVNLNNFSLAQLEELPRQFWSVWLKELAESKAAVFIGTDLHNQLQLDTFVSQWRNLDHREGRQENSLARFVAALDHAGIKPGRVVSAELHRLQAWLAIDKVDRARVS
jgi:histidinol phosphatase-like PHP family hydrolase